MQAFVSKSRRPEFELQLRIIDLNNVPLVSGTSFIKWHLPSSTAAEHRGRTPKSAIKDHKVVYDYDKIIPVRLIVGKDQMLQETMIHFEILQEYSSGGRGERITLGILDLNLAEYVEDRPLTSPLNGEDSSVGISRRYLMQQSKINSTLKVDIAMVHVRGERNYIVPPLRTAPVFGGIAGIIAPEADDAYHTQSAPGRNRETGERQDLYRYILASAWAASPNQLKADEVIEDIFGGGDGWGAAERKARSEAKRLSNKGGYGSNAADAKRRNSDDDDASPRQKDATSNISSFFRPTDRTSARRSDKSKHSPGNRSPKHGAISGRTGLEQQATTLGMNKKPDERRLQQNEVDEFDTDCREDLRSWQIRNVRVH